MKTYLLIGASHGIGLALAQDLLAQGHAVINWSRTAPELQHAHLSHHTFDAGQTPAELPQGADAMPEALDGLVYLPGSINLQAFGMTKPHLIAQDFTLNALGAVRCLQAAAKALKAGRGSVVLFSTVAVAVGMPFHTSVAMAKGAVEGLARSLAAEWAPTVRVNCIAPSLTDTPLATRLLATDEKRAAAAERHPLKRVGEASHVAALAAFLLSDKASSITGQVLRADGGISHVRG